MAGHTFEDFNPDFPPYWGLGSLWNKMGISKLLGIFNLSN